ALKNVEDTRIAQHTADRIFERKAVAAMDLQRVVRRAPGDAGAKQLRHTGFKVAATPFVLGPGRRVGELARHHDLDRHPGEFAGNARKFDDRPGELDTVQRITQAEFHRILRNAERAGRRLDAGALEGLHELLEAITLLAAEQVFRLHL